MIEDKDNLLGENSEIKNLKDNKQSQEELVEDLQSSLQNILSETSDLLKELTTTTENSIMDEEIRIESKKIISEISTDVSKALGGPLILKLTPKTPSPTFLPTKMLPINGIELIVLLIVVAGTNVPLKLIRLFSSI